MSKYWSDENDITPRFVFKHSNKKFVFNCDCGHKPKISPNNIVNGSWCGYCSSPPKNLCEDKTCERCYNNSFASYEKSKYWSVKNKIDPRKVFKTANKKFIFDCECGHEICIPLNSVIRGRWCSYCAHQKLCGDEKCKSCYNNSFASHEKSKYWSVKNNIDPRKVFKSSGKKFIFDCECGHEIGIRLNSVIKGCWCSYCSNPPKKLCDGEKCKSCYNNSFASHEKSKYWSVKNNIDPRKVFKNSHESFIFNCNCGHEIIKNIYDVNNDGWCGYCSSKLFCNKTNCKQCFEKSFASHHKSKFWNSKDNPRMIAKGSDHKYEFVCDAGHKFHIRLYEIKRGRWCGLCKNKSEHKLLNWLENTYGNIEYQKSFEWCKNIKNLPFDFCFTDTKLIIELDGKQHFSQVGKWTSPEKTRKRDMYKMECANKNGYSVIRIMQEDVWNDINDWEYNLIGAIKNYKNPKNIYLGEMYKLYF